MILRLVTAEFLQQEVDSTYSLQHTPTLTRFGCNIRLSGSSMCFLTQHTCACCRWNSSSFCSCSTASAAKRCRCSRACNKAATKTQTHTQPDRGTTQMAVSTRCAVVAVISLWCLDHECFQHLLIFKLQVVLPTHQFFLHSLLFSFPFLSPLLNLFNLGLGSRVCNAR